MAQPVRKHKIRVSTIEMSNNAQVLLLDSRFVAKATRALYEIESMKDKTDLQHAYDFLNELCTAFLDDEE